MFEFIRRHSKMVMILLFLLIIPSFVIVGSLDRYTNANTQGETVAVVDGQDITRQDWDAAHQREVERVRAGNPKIDPSILDSPQSRYLTLEGLVRDRVLAAAAHKSLLVTTDGKLARLLMQDPSILKPDGTVDAERYKALVAAQGMTPAAYESRLRTDVAQRQVLFGVSGTSFAPTALANATLNAFFERREIQFAPFRATDFASKVTPSDADLEAYYKANEADFKATEQASIEYVVLDGEAVKKSITANEQDLKSYYEQNVAAEKELEERRASHIMIEAPSSMSAADKAKAKARAEAILVDLRKAPNTFADVAKKDSQDAGSAANGGDLDFAKRGSFISKVLEDTAFGLKAKGDISDVVQSEFGFHIVRLTDIRLPKHRSFEEARPTLEAEYRNQQAQRKYSEAAEAFTNTVFEQSDSLQPVADKLKLEIRTATVGRTPAAGTTGALASRNFLNALFSSDSLEKQRNTQALEIGPSQLVAGRVVKHTPARTLPLADIKDQVRTAFVAHRALELATAEGEAKLKAWQAAPAEAKLSPPAVISRDVPGEVPPAVVEAALRADTAKLPALIGVPLDDQGYLVVKVNKVMPRTAPALDRAQQEFAQYTQAVGAAESMAYYELLKERFKVKFKVPKPELAAGANTIISR